MLRTFFIITALMAFVTGTAQASEMPDGKVLFSKNCTKCHGVDGTVSDHGKKLVPFPARNLRAAAPYVSSDELRRIITHGTHKSKMGAKKYVLDPFEIEALVDYIKTFTYKPNLANGQQRFKELCASCHGNDGRAQTGVGAKNLVYSKLSIEEKINTIRNGRSGTLMTAKRHQLSNVDIADIAFYTDSLKRAGNANVGGKLYAENCKSCHAAPSDIRITGNAAVRNKKISDLDDHMLDLRIRHGRHVDREGREAIKKLSSDDTQDIISYIRENSK
jgi:cytochrome c oxidase cbb3-type subunit 3